MSFKFTGVENMTFGGFEDEELDQAINKLIFSLMDKYEFVGCGRNRMVFKLKSGNYVLKVPLNMAGGGDNYTECNKKTDFGFPVAKTRHVELEGFGCVVMEHIKHVSYDECIMPGWVGYVDCGQVGFNKKGELVAYDFGYN